MEINSSDIYKLNAMIFNIILQPTYYNQGFFNVSVLYSANFGAHNSPISIRLGNNPNPVVIQAHINRTANNNGSPRIMGGVDLARWFQANFNVMSVLTIQIVNVNSIIIS